MRIRDLERASSRLFFWICRALVRDGIEPVLAAMHNSSIRVVRMVGFIGQLFQSGNSHRYLAIFVIGVALMMHRIRNGL